jgi:hypothetical protein
LLLTFAAVLLPMDTVAQYDQDQQQDPPSRVARLGFACSKMKASWLRNSWQFLNLSCATPI